LRAIILLAVAFMAGGVAPQATGSVQLIFSGLNGGGRVQAAVFRDEASWNRREGAFRTVTAPAGGAEVRIRVSDLPPGRYAVMAFHDRNADTRLNTLPIGLPTEPYGFSNNARGRFGPPGWARAVFEVSGETRQAIRLR
jgi:uncharacterized protein (DUF2141 family)